MVRAWARFHRSDSPVNVSVGCGLCFGISSLGFSSATENWKPYCVEINLAPLWTASSCMGLMHSECRTVYAWKTRSPWPDYSRCGVNYAGNALPRSSRETMTNSKSKLPSSSLRLISTCVLCKQLPSTSRRLATLSTRGRCNSFPRMGVRRSSRRDYTKP